jgi:CheY-like chemotaxis protein
MSKPVLLCIDDELDGLEVRKMVLESAGYSVFTAGNGKAGLELFTSQFIDLVILDYAMPEMSGYDVAVEMRRINPGIPILMLSAYFPVPQEVLNVVDAYATKGESPLQLFEEVGVLLKKALRHRKEQCRMSLEPPATNREARR